MDTIINPHFYIITGGPGVGKTALLDELAQQNYACIPEVARAIIKEQLSNKGNALPWADTALYTELMLQRSVDTYIEAGKNNSITFFDRGIPDTLSYAGLIHLPITHMMQQYATHYRYNQQVFILPPWKEIYTTDTERKQTWEEAVQTYEMLLTTFQRYNYVVAELPKAPVQQRVEMLLDFIQ